MEKVEFCLTDKVSMAMEVVEKRQGLKQQLAWELKLELWKVRQKEPMFFQAQTSPTEPKYDVKIMSRAMKKYQIQ